MPDGNSMASLSPYCILIITESLFRGKDTIFGFEVFGFEGIQMIYDTRRRVRVHCSEKCMFELLFRIEKLPQHNVNKKVMARISRTGEFSSLL